MSIRRRIFRLVERLLTLVRWSQPFDDDRIGRPDVSVDDDGLVERMRRDGVL